jgi:hypothetical protein
MAVCFRTQSPDAEWLARVGKQGITATEPVPVDQPAEIADAAVPVGSWP